MERTCGSCDHVCGSCDHVCGSGDHVCRSCDCVWIIRNEVLIHHHTVNSLSTQHTCIQDWPATILLTMTSHNKNNPYSQLSMVGSQLSMVSSQPLAANCQWSAAICSLQDLLFCYICYTSCHLSLPKKELQLRLLRTHVFMEKSPQV